jgi:phosphomannomutase
MPLIKSISGIRGTLGNRPGEDLTPGDVKKFARAFAALLQEKNWGDKLVLGRDARPSGAIFSIIITEVFISLGFQVIDLGLATTPTVEIAVIKERAAGGIIITASHNPIEWNALKLLNNQGEFLSADDGKRVLEIAEVKALIETAALGGEAKKDASYQQKHLALVLHLPLVEPALIAQAKFKIVVDGINSVGGVVIPELLRQLGVTDIIELNCKPDGQFAHQPEPLRENLSEIMAAVKENKADLGIVVDPDVDRLAFIDEHGEMFGEEYTLVAVADYVLENFSVLDKLQPGKYQKAAVSNLSSSRALADVVKKNGGEYAAAAVGEVNVVEKMKEIKAVIGGEGNGGVIFPELHYGRDALVGAALFLTLLAKSGEKMSVLRRSLPEYYMVKDKIALTPSINLPEILDKVKADYQTERLTTIDGLKIDWTDSWAHLRASNTEPIIRLYAEGRTLAVAAERIKEIKDKILAIIK